VYGLVTWVTAGNHRLAILVTGGFFVLGLLLLLGIDVARGRAAALAYDGGAGSPDGARPAASAG
jgi:UMF1 family MFS transporter